MAGLGWSADYICSWAKKMAEEDILWIDPKPDVSEEFNQAAGGPNASSPTDGSSQEKASSEQTPRQRLRRVVLNFTPSWVSVPLMSSERKLD